MSNENEQLSLHLEAVECDHSRPWFAPDTSNPVDLVLASIIASPLTRYSAWCRAQEIREARREAKRGRA